MSIYPLPHREGEGRVWVLFHNLLSDASAVSVVHLNDVDTLLSSSCAYTTHCVEFLANCVEFHVSLEVFNTCCVVEAWEWSHEEEACVANLRSTSPEVSWVTCSVKLDNS